MPHYSTSLQNLHLQRVCACPHTQDEMRGPVLELLREWLGQSIDVGSLVQGRRAEVDGVVTDTPGAPYAAQWFSLIVEAKPWMGGGSGKGQDAWHQVGCTSNWKDVE
jgi:hypothetical protein